jgi:hypothetical protein
MNRQENQLRAAATESIADSSNIPECGCICPNFTQFGFHSILDKQKKGGLRNTLNIPECGCICPSCTKFGFDSISEKKYIKYSGVWVYLSKLYQVWF